MASNSSIYKSWLLLHYRAPTWNSDGIGLQIGNTLSEIDAKGYLGWDDLWWDCYSNCDLGRHNRTMRLGKGGTIYLQFSF
ncbi:hypothetical protein JRO89_XS07G0123800 [Xanthoceras sorbifolium]|uniref:Uncharacterized protein n=1 Tax=Xanthoceras sorbifolium TaxID=99658 RepID=A0ABQ8HTQ5_9ROSI|nr:hypothetical protein JRO89_XS07G0123800 [Xanthoceras sorbifolium]